VGEKEREILLAGQHPGVEVVGDRPGSTLVQARIDEVGSSLKRLHTNTAARQSRQKPKTDGRFSCTTLWCSDNETPHALAPHFPSAEEILAGRASAKGESHKKTPKARSTLWA
jgi:hypothetical protein